MVMKRNRMRKNLTRSIWHSFGRYIAIVTIIALGCSIFLGLKVTKTDMIATGQEYMDRQNMFDLQFLNAYGWTDREVEAISRLDGVEAAEGSVYLDAFAHGDSGDSSVFRFHAMPKNINRVYLLSGRMPEKTDECLVDGAYFSEDMIGKHITVSETNDPETMENFHVHTYTVVGCISTPLYMDMTRGTTTLGSGSISTYIYIPAEALQVDYYTQIYVTIPGSWGIYSEEYTNTMNALAERLQVDAAPLAQQRFDRLLAEAEEKYADGLRAYEDGLQEYETGKAEALKKLADGLKELEDAQKELDEGLAELASGEQQMAEAQQKITDAKAELDKAMLELEKAKADTYTQLADAYALLQENYKTVTESLKQVEEGLAQLDAGLAQVQDGLDQIEENLPMLQLMIRLLEVQVKTTQLALDTAVQTGNTNLAETLQAQLEEQNSQLAEYESQLTLAQQTKQELEQTKEELSAQRASVAETQIMLKESLTAIEEGFTELDTNKKVAENTFAASEAKISAGYLELEAGQTELNEQRRKLEEGKTALAEGKTKLEEGWAEYEKGKLEAEAELADGEAQLVQAARELEEARQTIDDMKVPEVFVLTRDSNAGYLALDSNSDIVSGVAKVLPVFFLLIAALVCITTMTRMVEEERTQIGTMKALGHRNAAIMGKYLGYSGSAAVLGCCSGVAVGCTVFPTILWNAYKIIFNICPDLTLRVDWLLCMGVAAAYIAVSSLVTWYCCRRTLREVPAELIRPKAPEAGKKILLEYVQPVWKRLSFLNKVMLRNVFRYRQRFLMMLIGIGGCTGLLLTGFGLRDTVIDIANIQFSQVSRYDMEVYFSKGQSEAEKQAFLEQLQQAGIADGAGFFYQTSVEMAFDNKVRDVYLVAAGDRIEEYVSFQWDGRAVDMPGTGEAIISVGVSELLGIRVGDTVQVRNGDMQTLRLQVTGIYENYVNNYVIVAPETLEKQWGNAPADQMAYLTVGSGVDVHEAGAAVSGLNDVINVTVSADSAQIVNVMMEALDMVVGVIVFCAGLLAAVVLYNLTNININERIREIATIKVLGFRGLETSAYVFKENILLTVLGTGFGLILGRIFLEFVMLNIKIDMVWFKTRLTFPSYIYSVLLTLLCAALVALVFHRKLEKINMAEALKSVE